MPDDEITDAIPDESGIEPSEVPPDDEPEIEDEDTEVPNE